MGESISYILPYSSNSSFHPSRNSTQWIPSITPSRLVSNSCGVIWSGGRISCPSQGWTGFGVIPSVPLTEGSGIGMRCSDYGGRITQFSRGCTPTRCRLIVVVFLLCPSLLAVVSLMPSPFPICNPLCILLPLRRGTQCAVGGCTIRLVGSLGSILPRSVTGTVPTHMKRPHTP